MRHRGNQASDADGHYHQAPIQARAKAELAPPARVNLPCGSAAGRHMHDERGSREVTARATPRRRRSDRLTLRSGRERSPRARKGMTSCAAKPAAR